MIKINLAPKGKVARISKDIGSGPGGPENESIDVTQLQKQGAVKIVILFLVPFALYAYELQAIPEKRALVSSRQTLVNELVAKNNRAKSAVEETQKFNADRERLQAQIATIESLSKDRLKTVKILDTIQRDIPEKVWLSRVDVNETNVVLNGYAAADMDLTAFMDALQKSIHFREVNLNHSKEQTVASVSLKQFEINCIIEKSETQTQAGGGQ